MVSRGVKFRRGSLDEFGSGSDLMSREGSRVSCSLIIHYLVHMVPRNFKYFDIILYYLVLFRIK